MDKDFQRMFPIHAQLIEAMKGGGFSENETIVAERLANRGVTTKLSVPCEQTTRQDNPQSDSSYRSRSVL